MGVFGNDVREIGLPCIAQLSIVRVNFLSLYISISLQFKSFFIHYMLSQLKVCYLGLYSLCPDGCQHYTVKINKYHRWQFTKFMVKFCTGSGGSIGTVV